MKALGSNYAWMASGFEGEISGQWSGCLCKFEMDKMIAKQTLERMRKRGEHRFLN